MPKHDWHMLAVALIKEVLKHTSEDAWKDALIADSCTPQHKLLSASRHVKHPHLQSTLQMRMLDVARCCAVQSAVSSPLFCHGERHVLHA